MLSPRLSIRRGRASSRRLKSRREHFLLTGLTSTPTAGRRCRSLATALGRGWRFHRPGADPIDAVVALAIGLDRAEHVQPPVQLLGWL
jgi:hypothetical protein